VQKSCDVELQKELNSLKENMAGLSMVDEFAKYAKLQRQRNHIESILKENSEFFVLLKKFIVADHSQEVHSYQLLDQEIFLFFTEIRSI